MNIPALLSQASNCKKTFLFFARKIFTTNIHEKHSRTKKMLGNNRQKVTQKLFFRNISENDTFQRNVRNTVPYYNENT